MSKMQNIQSNENQPAIYKTVEEIRSQVKEWRHNDSKVALVPTMGALHEGHISLVKQAMQEADYVIVSIFVNPKQFAPSEDLDSYPRTWEEDLAQLTKCGIHGIFYPSVTEMYPEEFSTSITVEGITAPLEGTFRPDFFQGVTTVVGKLLLQTLPDFAFFGEKDYQQLLTVRKMVTDLNIPTVIRNGKTVRDENGLALSSRNAYLNEQQYKTAICLNKTLYTMAEEIKRGQDLKQVREWGISELNTAGFDKIDYLEICDDQTLNEPDDSSHLRILCAAWLGKARLIDNIPV